jgi:hypothetical protein
MAGAKATHQVPRYIPQEVMTGNGCIYSIRGVNKQGVVSVSFYRWAILTVKLRKSFDYIVRFQRRRK